MVPIPGQQQKMAAAQNNVLVWAPLVLRRQLQENEEFNPVFSQKKFAERLVSEVAGRMTPAQAGKLVAACRIPPANLRYFFLQYGVQPIMRSSNFEPNEANRIIWMVAKNMAGERKFLPQEAIKFFSSPMLGYCSESYVAFIRAGERGTLVEALMPLGAQIVPVLVKGFFSYSGNVIAVRKDEFEARRRFSCESDAAGGGSFTYYSIELKDGAIIGAKLA